MAEQTEEYRLCRIDEISDPGARGFEFGQANQRLEFIALRRGDLIRVFINHCPHQGTPLEIFPDRFLTRDAKYLLCSTHGAEFRLDDGLCLKGPCKGQALKMAGFRIDDGVLMAYQK